MSATVAPTVATAHCSERLAAMPREALQTLRRGIEKESLRVRPDGTLATTPHPAALGSALTHPHITTDFSESQLGAHHRRARRRGELPRGADRDPPGRLPRDRRRAAVGVEHAVPACRRTTRFRSAATAPPTSAARRRVYRMGLSHRYGRRMQTISGIHYNFSLPDARSNDDYFALIRNFRRHSWLLLYLFGASPAVCSSFVAGRDHRAGALERRHASTCRTRRRCAWGGSATRATRSPRSR